MPKMVTLSSGPWKGVYETTTNETTTRPDMLSTLTNGYIEDTVEGSSVLVRPGFDEGAAMGSMTGQGSIVHVMLDGTVREFVVAGGKVYRTNGVSPTGSVAPTLTDVSPLSGATISTTARVYMVSFGDAIIVSDGTNQPWIMTDLGGANVDAVEIEYNTAGSAWSAYGKPTVYAGKLFFIANYLNGTVARNAILWSEEGDAATGYQQDSYDNLWELTQADTSSLTAILGTNSALYYWRADSIGYIAGKVDTDFQTSATTDGVSQTIGTTSPGSVCVVEDYIWFLDLAGRPWRFRPGGSLEPVWHQRRNTYSNKQQAANLGALERYGMATHHVGMGLVIFTSLSGSTVGVSLRVFAADTARALGDWQLSSGSPHLIGTMIDDNKQTRFFLGISVSSNFYVCLLGQPAATPVSEPFGLGAPQLTLGVERVGYSVNAMYAFDEFTMTTDLIPSANTVTLNISTSTNSVASPGTIALGRSTAVNGDERYTAGLNRQGRYATVSVVFSGATTATLSPVRVIRFELLGRELPVSPYSP